MKKSSSYIREIEMGGAEDLLVDAIISRIHPAKRTLDAFKKNTLVLDPIRFERLKRIVNNFFVLLISKDIEELQKLSLMDSKELKKQDLIEEGMLGWHNDKADFEQWSRRSLWSTEECVALSLGLDPELVNWDLIEEYGSSSRIGKQFRDRREELNRAVEARIITAPIRPNAFVKWSASVGLSIPNDLKNMVAERADFYIDWRARYQETAEEFERYKFEVSRQQRNTSKGGSDTQLLPAAHHVLAYLLHLHDYVDLLSTQDLFEKTALANRIRAAMEQHGVSPRDGRTITNAMQLAVDRTREFYKLQSRKHP